MAHIVGVPKRDPCQKCELPVFLAERLMIGKYVYHRTCLRCARCNSQLTPGNFYETETDGEYCCETCPDEEKKLDVATSSKDCELEAVKPNSIASQLAFFEKDGCKVLQKSLSDEEKSQSLKKFTENQLQYIYKTNSARSSFLNNPSSGECDSHNSSRRNSDSSSDTTSSDKTNGDVSKEPPELPKSLPPLLSEDETYGSSSFHIKESTSCTIEQDNKSIPKIPHVQNIQLETSICDLPSVEQIPSVIDSQKSESIDAQKSESIDSCKRESKASLVPAESRYKMGANINETHSKARNCEDLSSQLICMEKSNDTMDFKCQDRLSSDYNFEIKVKSQSPEIKSSSEEGEIVEKNEIDTLSQEPPKGTEKPKLSTGPCDQQQDNNVEFCNDLIILNKCNINVTKDNSENDGEMTINNVLNTRECIKELPTTDTEQPVVNSESSKSMVRTRLHQFEDIANKSQNSSISNLSKNRISHSSYLSKTCNVERPQSSEMELCISVSDKSEKAVEPKNSEKLEKSDTLGKADEPENSEKLDTTEKSDELDNSEKLKKSDTSDKSDKPDNSETLEKSGTSDKADESENSEKLDTLEKAAELDHSEKLKKLDTSEKGDELDNSEKLEKSDTSDKSDKPDNSEPSEGVQEKKIDDYPEELNPFKSDEEEENQSSQRKTNPFESSDEEEKTNETTHSNPFGSESEDDNASSRSVKLPVPTPRITKSSGKIKQTPMFQNTQDCCGVAHLDQYQNLSPSQKPTYCGCNRGVTKNRKKKPAPQPPKVSKEIFSSINQDSKKSSPGSSTASTPTTMRKKRPAPSPPGQSKAECFLSGKNDQLRTSKETASTAQEEVRIEKPQAELEKLCDEEKARLEGSSTNISCNESISTNLDQENESTKTSKRRLIALDASLVEDANSSEDLKLKEEDNVVYRRTLVPPVLDDSTLSQSLDTSESHDRQLEKMKDNKEAKNRNRQSQISLPCEENDPLYNKSVHGKWKRRKGPAPALPIPPKKVLQMLPLQEIRHELEIIEVQQQGLEKQGVMLEKMIRERCEGPAGEDNIEGSPNPPNSKEVEDLILQLFELVNEKNELFRRQAELMYLRRQHRLEQEQADLEYEIRVLMAQPERNKTDSDKAREEALIARLVEVVQLRNEVVECLEMDRLREAEEDLSIKQRLEMHSAKRDEELSKQTPTKLSKKEKKKQKEHKKIGKSKKLDADKDADESELNAENQKAKKKKKKFLF